MCACEGTYVCPHCADTPADPAYAEWPEDVNVPVEGHRSALDATGAV
jgi:hypothetical protein